MRAAKVTPIKQRLKLEKGIPLTKTHQNVGAHRSEMRMLIESMKAGESFQVPEGFEIKVRGYINSVQIRSEKRFSVRKHDGGFRCWRTA